MQIKQNWNPKSLLESPFFRPISPIIERLDVNVFPSIDEWNRLLLSLPEIRVKNGHHLSFVAQAQGKLAFESQYEPRCFLTGEVQTRANNWHDLFNALVWLSFPRAKAAINSRHYQSIVHQLQPDTTSQRGKVRDMATLFDESGVVVVTARPALAEMLYDFKWKELFWNRRDDVSKEMDFYIFGHGLYEKSLSPYVGMTGQGLILNVEQDFFSWPLPVRLSWLDREITAYLDNPENCQDTRELSPVPLLGFPDCWADNTKEIFYENTAYFRPHRGRS